MNSKGFGGVLRNDVEVQVGGRLGIDFKLEVATSQTVIQVSATSTPILESESATVGTVVAGRRISELPLVNGNAFMLANTSAGVMVNNEVMNSHRPFDNTGPTGIRTNGAPGGNTFTLDGAPNTGNRVAGSAQVAYVPPSDAVEEFKVETASFDAQHGYTPGANVNVSIKSGTNQLHGSGYEFYRPPDLVAEEFFAKQRKTAPQLFTYHRFGGTVGGPIFIPKSYDGRNKSFFFVSHEGILNDTPSSGIYTVPTVAERTGNFAGQALICDPLAATQEGGRIAVRHIAPGFDLAALGFPASTISQFRRESYFPQMTINGFSSLGSTQGDFTAANNVFPRDNSDRVWLRF